jgi:hypothetical protein
MNKTERPPADAGYEEKAKEMIAEGYSPEGYAAHFGHNWLCFSMGEVRFADPATDAWIQRLDDIFFGLNGAPSVAECRARYLTAEERAKIEKVIQEMNEKGL